MGKLVLSALVAASALSAALPRSGEQPTDGRIWYPDYQEARSVARETGRPLFVTFR